MALNIVERPALTLVGMHIRTKPMSPEIPALWPRFVARIDEIADTNEPQVSYGVMRDDAGTLHYSAAVSVSKADKIPSGLEALAIPAGSYAVFSYPLSGLGKGFGEIFGSLLPSSNYVQDGSRPLYERYDEKFDPRNPNSVVQIGIPVKSRK